MFVLPCGGENPKIPLIFFLGGNVKGIYSVIMKVLTFLWVAECLQVNFFGGEYKQRRSQTF